MNFMFPYTYLSPLLEQGQAYLAEKIKILVYNEDPELFGLLDFNDDSIFLEPFLFGYFTSPKVREVTLRQLLFGYLPDKRKFDATPVFADKKGVIYLPNVGYVCTALSNEQAMLRYDKAGNDIRIEQKDQKIAHTLTYLLTLDGTTFEVLLNDHPFFADYLAEWNDDLKDFEEISAEAEIEETSLQFLSQIKEALSILRQLCPEQFEQYLACTQKIVIFNNPKIRNFAVRNMHGCIFISARQGQSPIFFLEEIVHQCSHNAFNAITFDLSKHFLVDPETPLIQYSQVHGEFRSIYSALHGLYTVATRLEVFDHCINLTSGLIRHEVIGRFADLRRRFRNGLEKLPLNEIFTSHGRCTYQLLDQYCAEIFDKRHYLIDKFNYSNQKSGFDFQKFCELNRYDALENIVDFEKDGHSK